MKSTMKTSRRFALKNLMIGAAAIALSTSNAFADTITLSYNQWFPTGHWSQKGGLYKWFDEIKDVTEGRVVVQPSAKPLAPPNRNYQAVELGVADIAWGPHGYTPGVFPLTEMVELPFITHDAGVSSLAYWRLWKEYFEATGMQNSVVTLAMHVTAGGNISMKKEPITGLADLKGKKLRIPTPVVGRVLQQVDAVPISGSLGELREMLSRGIVDGTVISDELVTGFKVDKYVGAVTRIPGGLFSSSAFVIVNKEKWNQISEADRKAIMEISGESLSQRMGALWHENDIKAREAMKERLGDQYMDASTAFVAELEEAFADQQDAWLAQAELLGVDGKAAIGFYQDQIKAQSK